MHIYRHNAGRAEASAPEEMSCRSGPLNLRRSPPDEPADFEKFLIASGTGEEGRSSRSARWTAKPALRTLCRLGADAELLHLRQAPSQRREHVTAVPSRVDRCLVHHGCFQAVGRAWQGAHGVRGNNLRRWAPNCKRMPCTARCVARSADHTWAVKQPGTQDLMSANHCMRTARRETMMSGMFIRHVGDRHQPAHTAIVAAQQLTLA